MKVKWLLIPMFLMVYYFGLTEQVKSGQEEELSQDCSKFEKIILDFVDYPTKQDQPIWSAYSNDIVNNSRYFSHKIKRYGEGLLCVNFINAGGQQFNTEGFFYKNNVEYNFLVYETTEQAREAVETKLKGQKVIVSKNRVFSYFVDKNNKKNVSKVIVKAAEDFLKSTE